MYIIVHEPIYHLRLIVLAGNYINIYQILLFIYVFYNVSYADLSVAPPNPMLFQGFNNNISFVCISNIDHVSPLQWFINEVLLQDPLMDGISIIPIASDLSRLVITNVSENITIQCAITNPVEQSNIATLSVQGMLVI